MAAIITSLVVITASTVITVLGTGASQQFALTFALCLGAVETFVVLLVLGQGNRNPSAYAQLGTLLCSLMTCIVVHVVTCGRGGEPMLAAKTQLAILFAVAFVEWARHAYFNEKA